MKPIPLLRVHEAVSMVGAAAMAWVCAAEIQGGSEHVRAWFVLLYGFLACFCLLLSLVAFRVWINRKIENDNRELGALIACLAWSAVCADRKAHSDPRADDAVSGFLRAFDRLQSLEKARGN